MVVLVRRIRPICHRLLVHPNQSSIAGDRHWYHPAGRSDDHRLSSVGRQACLYSSFHRTKIISDERRQYRSFASGLVPSTKSTLKETGPSSTPPSHPPTPINVAPSGIEELQRRMEGWHLKSSTTQGIMSEEERQDHLDLARLELKWMMDSSSSSASSSRPTPSTSEDGRARLEEMVRRRVEEDEPLAYILGNQPFGKLDLLTRPPILIPRTETEDWTLRLVSQLSSNLDSSSSSIASEGQGDTNPTPLRILDLCSGSGCIGLTLASYLQEKVKVTCVDVSLDAIALTRENLIRNGIDEGPNGVSLLRADLFSSDDLAPLTSYSPQFHIVACNPPYIPRDEYEALHPTVRRWEDPTALLGEEFAVSEVCQSSSRSSRGERLESRRQDGEGEEASAITTPTIKDQDGLAFYRRLADVLDLLLIAPPTDKATSTSTSTSTSTVRHLSHDDIVGDPVSGRLGTEEKTTRMSGMIDEGVEAKAQTKEHHHYHHHHHHHQPLPALLLEVGQGQADVVLSIFQRRLATTTTSSMMDFEKWRDPWDVERVVVGYWRR